jgi:lipid-A-disaccharide synthase
MMSYRIMFVAGEASGDLHGAHLVQALKKRLPTVEICGVGGTHLQQAGMTLLSSSDELGVVGVSEVIKKLGTVWRVYRKLCQFLRTQRPNLVILIDYPDFNFRMAKFAHKLRIPIVYYISPQVWAWRSGRVKFIQRFVTKMLVIFPFEREFYQQYGVDVEWVGHPLVETVKSSLTKEEFCQQHGLDPTAPMIGILPGSRESEVHRLLPVMLSTAQHIRQQQPNVQFVLPLASSLQTASLFVALPPSIHLIRNQTYETINAADLVVTASGTVTVETALLETPMIITYIVSPLTYWLGKRLINVPFIGMVNLIAGKQIVPELIQHAVTPERITQEILTLLHDPAKLAAIKQELRIVREKLGEPGAPDRAAAIIAEVLTHSG